MNSLFRQHVEALHPKFEMLIGMAPTSFSTLSDVTTGGGIYLLSEASEHLYIGRAKNIRSRLRMHTSGPDGASFAVKLARITLKRPATYQKANGLKQLRTEAEFLKAFDQARDRIRKMDVRFVEEPECNAQALLEIYATLALGTRYNDFDTH